MFNYKSRIGTAVSVFMVSFIFSGSVFADDLMVIAGLKEVQGIFDQRSPSNPKPIEDALKLLSNLEGQATDPNLNYDVLILESRALYWKGQHQNSVDQQLVTYMVGQAKASKAKELNPNFADAYYFAGIHLGRWAELKGAFQAIGKKGELIEYMNNTMKRYTRDGQPGESIDGDGPNRVFGRMYFKLPGILGGSRAKALQYLSKAVSDTETSGYRVPLNVIFYAETLSDGSRSEKDQARKMLDELLKKDPANYNPNRVPENQEEFALAKELRSKL